MELLKKYKADIIKSISLHELENLIGKDKTNKVYHALNN